MRQSSESVSEMLKISILLPTISESWLNVQASVQRFCKEVTNLGMLLPKFGPQDVWRYPR